MWDNFWAVIKDLAVFAWQQCLVLKSSLFKKTDIPTTSFIFETVPKLTAPIRPLAIQSAAVLTDDFAAKNITENQDYFLAAPEVMYVSNSEGAKCFNLPRLDFDCLISVLPYGVAVTVIGYNGRYASINRSNVNGWIFKDDLSANKNKVWPNFIKDVDYDYDHEDTIKVRNIIQDSFSAGVLKLPLTSGEYVTCRLMADNRLIPWSRKRPRNPGSWHDLLKGLPNVHVGIFPKADSLVEWQAELEQQGSLAYVESVSADKSIVISAVGLEHPGRYSKLFLTEEQWKELRPVFIEVN